jgi:FkbH-like protein
MTELHWLPNDDKWRVRLAKLRQETTVNQEDIWKEATALANLQMDFVRTNALDQTLRAIFKDTSPSGLGIASVRLAMLGSCTMAHLHGAIRVAGVRRGIWITIYENDYGQYYQELADPESALHAFNPTVLLLAQDAHHHVEGVSDNLDVRQSEAVIEERSTQIANCWRLARKAFNCQIIQQTALPVHPDVLGLNEHRMPGSRAHFIYRLNYKLRLMAEEFGIDLLTLDTRAAKDGISSWHDVSLWHRAKQEISPAAAPLYGDLIGRLIAARQGRSFKCLVLDLDNTLWGGVVGDDGLDGIIIGQGSPLGEAYIAFQAFALELSHRGVILAVCSKNDEAIAVEPFEKHPEMVLKRSDIASFKANWNDKATNIKNIAAELNIGLDSLVFVDDNPVERAWIRQELPMVAVPEVTDDPMSFVRALSDAGYFETTLITAEDRLRSEQYQGNRQREALRSSATDMTAYLRGLKMELVWRHFDQVGLQRIVQLINKTNQFNLTTRRYTQEDVIAIMRATNAFGLQLRLIDRFGDNGIIAICIGKMLNESDLLIDTWLMSCRVLGRQLELVTLDLIAAQAKRLGAKRLIGDYIPKEKNAMVMNHYVKLGFTIVETHANGSSRAILDLADFVTLETFISVAEGELE